MDLPTTARASIDALVRPMRTLWLLAAAHAVNHAQAALLPLVYLAIIKEFGVTVAAIAFLTAVGSLLAGLLQLAYGAITRFTSRRAVMTIGGLLFGGGMAAQALAPSFAGFAAANVVSRLGASPQHPVGNGLLAEQFPPARRGFAISAHIAGGNVGTVAVPLVGTWLIAGIGWRSTVVLFGVPAILIALAIWSLVHESGADRAAARAAGSLRDAFRVMLQNRDLWWVFASSVLGGGGRGLGVVNIFVPIYLSRVIGLDDQTVGLMFTALLAFSVPAPLVGGWLGDRVGRKRVINAVYVGGAVAFVVFVAAGSSVPLLWLGIVLLGIFNFVESPQLQALLADIAGSSIRDVAFSTYFTLAFGVGSLWTAVYGAVIDRAGETAGLPLVFLLMGAAFVAAAAAILPVRERRAGPVREPV